MPSPLVRTKLYVPRARHTRGAAPRLAEPPEHQRAAAADPGLGAGGVRQDDARWRPGPATASRPVAWVSLEETEQQPASFWTYVVTALDTAVPGVGAGVLPLLQAPAPAHGVGPRHPAQRARRPARRRRPGPRRLPPRRRARDRRRRRVPGRAPAPARAPGDQHPRRPRAAPGPAAGARRAGRGPRRRPALHARGGDGIPQRRRRAATSTAPRSPRSRAGPRAGSPPSSWPRSRSRAATTPPASSPASPGDDRYVVDYLVEEVLGRQPDAVRRFLLDTSVLDRLSGSALRRRHRRGDDGRAMLESLERANLFVIPLDDSRQWYRYHHLFADVLRAHLVRGAARRGRRPAPAGRRVVRRGGRAGARRPARARGRRRRAGRRPRGALGHRHAARAAGGDRARAGSTQIPAEVVRRRPVLAVGFIGALMSRGEFAAVDGPARRRSSGVLADPPADLVVLDEARAGPRAGSDGDLSGRPRARRRRPGRHGRPRRPGDRPSRAGRRPHRRGRVGALAGLASWARRRPGVGPPRATRSPWRASSGPATSRTCSAARSPSATSGSPRVGSGTPGGPTRTRSGSPPPTRSTGRCAGRRTWSSA